ncbi:major facilitator superfamily domain-containing protein [Gigaspora rosea]|uniref:Major facilitator superfamily domain-containing protein n=1 Tax=Gigaspora rosea TaxID=44941 RepID=A0A397UD91_9GLOM|nr:major facilitator superfamily domain-containing protein [Gigaspora rosea]
MSSNSRNSIDNSEKLDEFTNNSTNVLTNIESAEEKRLLKKIDLRIIPLVTLLYTLSFLDRGYVLFEVPSNIALIKIKPSIWISTLMVGWGIIMTGMAFVKNFSELMAVRFLLGAFESGLFPGVVFYLTKWYKKSERTYRISLFFSGATIAGAFNGLLAYAITNLDGKFNLHGWQWLFILDGVMTVIVAFFSYFLISDYAETASWLTEDERKLAVDRLRYDGGHAHTTHFDKHQILRAFKDSKIYIYMCLYFCLLVTLYSFSFFVPTIVNGLGFNTVISQLLSTPPFVLGCISCLVIAKLSDNFGVRSPYLLFCILVSIFGYAILIVPNASTPAKYTAVCIVGLGAFPTIPTMLAWLTNNLAGDSKRAVGTAMVIAWGNIGGVISAQIYRSSDAPAYKTGHSIALSLLVVAVIITIIQHYLLKRINKYKLENPELFLKGSNGDASHLGDSHPSFIYGL